MTLRNTFDRFGALAKLFHWFTFLLLLGSFTLAFTMAEMPLSPKKLEVYSWHKWVGVTVFFVTLLRLGWRLRDPVPPLPSKMPAIQRGAARLSHGALYTLLLAIPVLGWAMSSAYGLPTVYLGLVPLPDLVAANRELGDGLKSAHHLCAFVLLALVALHIAAALYHHFLIKDDILTRMLPWRSDRKAE